VLLCATSSAGSALDRSRSKALTEIIGAHHGDDLFDLGRIGGIPQSLVAGRAAGVESGHCRRRATSAGAIEQ
jgi:hypothetical protein